MKNELKGNITENNDVLNSILDNVLESLAQSRLKTNQIDIINGAGVMLKDVFTSIDLDVSNNLHNAIELKLKNDGLIEYPNPNFNLILRISDKGFDFWKNGGYIQQQKEINDKVRKRRFNRKLKIWTFIITVIGAIIGLLTLVKQ